MLDPSLLQALHELHELDRSGTAELVRLFLDDTRSRLDALRAVAGGGNREVLAATAHSLKGSCANFAASTMASLCVDLETAARADVSLASPILDQLDHEYDRVAGALRSEFQLDDL